MNVQLLCMAEHGVLVYIVNMLIPIIFLHMPHPLDLSWSLCRLAQIRSESVETITDVQSVRPSNWTPRATSLSWLAATSDNVFIFYSWCHCSLNNVSFNFVSLSRLILIP